VTWNLITTGAIVEHTLQVNPSLRRRQRKPVQFWPGFRIEVGLSASFGADTACHQPISVMVMR
jgi:hypothetical protein